VTFVIDATVWSITLELSITFLEAPFMLLQASFKVFIIVQATCDITKKKCFNLDCGKSLREHTIKRCTGIINWI
jgi:hypothetical protein